MLPCMECEMFERKKPINLVWMARAPKEKEVGSDETTGARGDGGKYGTNTGAGVRGDGAAWYRGA